jgi:hypothetical protein
MGPQVGLESLLPLTKHNVYSVRVTLSPRLVWGKTQTLHRTRRAFYGRLAQIFEVSLAQYAHENIGTCDIRSSSRCALAGWCKR